MEPVCIPLIRAGLSGSELAWALSARLRELREAEEAQRPYVSENPDVRAFCDQLVADGGYAPSGNQERILDWLAGSERSAQVGAVAGSGKSTTIRMAVQAVDHFVANRIALPGFRASERPTIHAVAFNKSIVLDLAPKLKPFGATVSTMNSHAWRALLRMWDGPRAFIRDTGKPKGRVIVDELLRGPLPNDPKGDRIKEARKVLGKLMELVRVNMLPHGDVHAVEGLADHHGLPLATISPLGAELRTVADLVWRAVEMSDRAFEETGEADFTDQLWQPIRLGLRLPQYDLFMVDECQDLNRLQQAVMLASVTPGGRVLAVGDKAQAIYGFAGADAVSYDRTGELLDAVRLPLSITYRCASRIVEVAQVVVPLIEAAPGAPAGKVRVIAEDLLGREVREKDLIVGRVNAPLIRLTIQLIARRVNARMKGRDIGQQLVSRLEDVATRPGFVFAQLVPAIDAWANEQVARLVARDASETAVEAVRDTALGLTVCADSFPECRTIPELATAILGLFADEGAAVWLSSVHRAKGLEADRVFVVSGEKMPLLRADQQPWEREQEMNALYVAVTRAKTELIFAGAVPDPLQAVVARLAEREEPSEAPTEPAPAPAPVTPVSEPRGEVASDVEPVRVARAGGALGAAAFRQRKLEL